MDGQTEKCVMVLDERNCRQDLLPIRRSILGITLGKHIPKAVGPDVTDRSSYRHLGIISSPYPSCRQTGKHCTNCASGCMSRRLPR